MCTILDPDGGAAELRCSAAMLRFEPRRFAAAIVASIAGQITVVHVELRYCPNECCKRRLVGRFDGGESGLVCLRRKIVSVGRLVFPRFCVSSALFLRSFTEQRIQFRHAISYQAFLSGIIEMAKDLSDPFELLPCRGGEKIEDLHDDLRDHDSLVRLMNCIRVRC